MIIEESGLFTSVKNQYLVEQIIYDSDYLDRQVTLDIYFPVQPGDPSKLSLLLINDGQDLPAMPFTNILNSLAANGEISPLLAVGIYCNEDRKLEYGTADEPDYLNRGSRAKFHRKFVLKELLPFLRKKFYLDNKVDTAFAGFSLGGLSALDITWKHPEIFSTAAVFSGSLWWRSRDLENGYQETTDRIMHKLIRQRKFVPGQKFFFEAGRLDETMDRNNNGIIDSIDDTLDLVYELEQKGYKTGSQVKYLELPLGRHDVATWAAAFPEFLKWSYGK